MEKVKYIISKSYKFIVYILSILLFLLIIYFNIKQQNLKIFIIAIIALGGLITLNKFVINKANKKVCNIATIFLILIFLTLEVLAVKYFRVEYNWDFKWIMESAHQMYKHQEIAEIQYFKIFPNNIPTLYIAYIGMCLFNGEFGAYIINIIFIFIAIIYTVLVARKIGGEKLGLNVALLCILFSPLYLYSPIVYSDSLALMFPVAIIYYWILAKENIKSQNYKKAVIYGILMTILGTIGFAIKAVVIIVLVAIYLDSIFMFKKQLKYIVISLIIFFIINSCFSALYTKYIIKDVKHNNWVYPYTHWVMMGLNKPISEGGVLDVGYGNYSASDAILTESKATYTEKVQTNITVIKQRLKEFGFYGYIRFLYKKSEFIWADSGFYVFTLLNWDPIDKTSNLYNIFINPESNKIFVTYTNIIYIIVLILILVGSIIDIKSKNNEEHRIFLMICIGITMFLLIWEARSRYLYFIIPILCLLASIGLKNISELKFDINKIKFIKKGEKT